MHNSFTLTITAPGMSPFFMRDAPDGIRFIAPPITGQRSGFEVHVNVDLDIKLIVDVAKIGSVAAALWLVERIRRSKIDLRPAMADPVSLGATRHLVNYFADTDISD